MSVRSAPLTVGRVRGFRGRSGEVTVQVASGEAARWTHLGRVALVAGDAPSSEGAPGPAIEVEGARAYRDRLVLKLRGIDDASSAERLTGLAVVAPENEVPQLPEDVYWIDRLIGSRVLERSGEELGRVEDVIATGGCDLLVVRAADGDEILVPLARSIVTAVDVASGTIRVALPEGLRELNAGEGREGTP